jgi:hypothetical protein
MLTNGAPHNTTAISCSECCEGTHSPVPAICYVCCCQLLCPANRISCVVSDKPAAAAVDGATVYQALYHAVGLNNADS